MGNYCVPFKTHVVQSGGSTCVFLLFSFYECLLYILRSLKPKMKRRRTRTPSDAGSPSQEAKKAVKSPPVPSKSNISSDVQVAANQEEMEVDKRSAASDVASFERGTEEIRKLVAEIQEQKLSVGTRIKKENKNTSCCTTSVYLLQVKFDFRSNFIFLCS